MNTILLLLTLTFSLVSFSQDYPAEWFKEVPRAEAESWEILPQDASAGEVVLSKRTELGAFSNLAVTVFVLDQKAYSSVEGLWQSLKYPDHSQQNDPRLKIIFPFQREQVELMSGFEAKKAGDEANKIYKAERFKQVSYGSHFFDYKDHSAGSEFHYQLIRRAMKAKLDQNPSLWALLLRTGCLKLRPDHKLNDTDPPAYHYYKIYMELRSERQLVSCSR